jgi:Fe2+ transport system protein FeoA
MTLVEVAAGRTVTIEAVGGERPFRRRLLEFGLLPGTEVTVTGWAPFGDSLTLTARGCYLSLRASEARCVSVKASAAETRPLVRAP